MKRLLPFLALGLAASGAAWAQDMGSLEDLFPAMPCHDGWAACLVDGSELGPAPTADSAGRPMPSDLRVGWFDLTATDAFDPFQGLSDYTGELPKVAKGGGARDALLDGAAPVEPAVADVDPEVEDPEVDDPEVDDRAERSSGAMGDEPDRFVEAAPTGGNNGGSDFGDPVVIGDNGSAKGSSGGSTGGSFVADPYVPPEPEPYVEPEPEPEPEPVVVEPEPEPKIVEPEPEPEPEPVVVDVEPEPEPMPTSVSCDNLVQLEPAALMGKLNEPQATCLEGRMTGVSQTQKDKISRVLLANAEASSNKKEWERLIRRHLEDIDRSDPNLCFKYALHLSRGGVGRAWGVIKWADYALENKTQWSGTTYKTRVYSLYQLKAEAAVKLWQDANTKLVEAGGANRDELAAKEEKLRGMAKDYAREWLDYARASSQDTKKPMALCVSAAGSKKYCEDK